MKTIPKITKFEKARILGLRAYHISKGTPLLIETQEIDPLKIAKEEFEKKVIPMIIRRYFPDGTFEDVKIKDL